MSAMSTPINQLPANKPTTATIPDDPEVLNVLDEMEKEVKSAAKVNSAPMMMPPPPASMMMPPHQHPHIQIKRVSGNKWVNKEVMQRAGIVAVLAAILFYPKTLQTLYSTVPKLAFLEKFDVVVRAALLAVVVYLVSIQFTI